MVSVVITSSEREGLRNKLRKIEQMSGKGTKKWTKASRSQRKKYIEFIIADKDFVDSIFYSRYSDTRAYIDLTILTTAKALLDKAEPPYETTIFVDGLKKTERYRFAAGLRKLKIKVRKVRGIREQSDEFIRLADAVAGFVRDSLEGDQIMEPLYQKAEQNKVIRKI